MSLHVTAEWGAQGVHRAIAQRATVIIIVDVLSFSTAVDVAVGCGADVVPHPYGDHGRAKEAALEANARLAYPRAVGGGQLSLSPVSLATLAAGERVLLPSPNGSALSHLAADSGATVLCGCLRNADAVGALARRFAGDGMLAMVPAGERWEDGSLRPAIEDLLGAGAIIASLGDSVSCDAEATLMRAVARAEGPRLADLVRGSQSGRELIDRGFSGDVDMAVECNVSSSVPQLVDGIYRHAAM